MPYRLLDVIGGIFGDRPARRTGEDPGFICLAELGGHGFCSSNYDRKIALVVKRIEPAPDQRQIIAFARLIKDHGANEFFKIRASTERSNSCPNIARFVSLEGKAT
jgi:hypothetical protein